MAYFRQTDTPEQTKKHLFRVPVKLDDPYEEDGLQDWQDDPSLAELTASEEQLQRRDRARMVFAVGDFFGVLLGAVLILLLIAMLVSLINWVMFDVSQFLETWRS